MHLLSLNCEGILLNSQVAERRVLILRFNVELNVQKYTSLEFEGGGYVLQSFLANWEYWKKFVLELHVKVQLDNAVVLKLYV